MGLFGKILEKLGLRKEEEEEQPAAKPTVSTGTTASVPRKPEATAPAPKPTTVSKPSGAAPTSQTGVSTTTSVADKRQKDDVAVKHEPAAVSATATAPKPISTAPKPMSEVDVMNMLEQKAKGSGLNWKQSISDLLFLLDMDNSYDARVELAKELDAPQEVMGDSARMNTWLHKTVLRKIAENGGNIPQELLD
jgi:hypothetical protein